LSSAAPDCILRFECQRRTLVFCIMHPIQKGYRPYVAAAPNRDTTRKAGARHA
jgi:hypothetical protein